MFSYMKTLVLPVMLSSLTVFGQNVDEPSDLFAENQEGVKVTELTKDEYIAKLARLNSISMEEAADIIKTNTQNQNPSFVSNRASRGPDDDNTFYREYIIEYNYGLGTKVEAGALARIYSYGSFRNFQSVDRTWSEASGSGPYTWKCFYITPRIIDGYKLELLTRGAVEVAVTGSVTISGNAGVTVQGLVNIGFQASGTIGSTVYLRKVGSFSRNWSLY